MTQRKSKSVNDILEKLLKEADSDSDQEESETQDPTRSNFIHMHGILNEDELKQPADAVWSLDEESDQATKNILNQGQNDGKGQKQDENPDFTQVLNKSVKTPTDSELALFKDKNKSGLSSSFSKNDQHSSHKQRNDEDEAFQNPTPPMSQNSLNQPSMLTLFNNLKLAEKKIKELEESNNQIRLENQKLIVSGEALQESLDKLSNEYKELKSSYGAYKSNWVEQKKVMEQEISSHVLEVKRFKNKIAVLEKYLERDVKSVRKKERELENKLMIKQEEISATIRDKDKLLIKLRMELDQSKESIRSLQEENDQLNEKLIHNSEKSHRVIRALQLSLSLLKGEEGDTAFHINKESEEHQENPEKKDDSLAELSIKKDELEDKKVS